MTQCCEITAPERFRHALEASLGFSFDDGKLAFLSEVLKRRTAATGFSLEAYLSRLEAGALRGESGPLAEELTVGETYFFRNNEQFQAFRDVVLPERMQAARFRRPLRVLSAGCASGEEAFSIAMAARDVVASPPWQVSIDAVDINPAALRRAAAGRFSEWALRETPPQARERWFARQGRGLVLSDEIRSSVRFAICNLAAEDDELWVRGAYDAIFCRNVVMYFTPEVQMAVIERIARALAPGGFLFLGHAESLRWLSERFDAVNSHGTFYYRRKSDNEGPSPYFPVTRLAGAQASKSAPGPSPASRPADTEWHDKIAKAGKRIQALAGGARTRPGTWQKTTGNLDAAIDLLRRERFAEALAAIRAIPSKARAASDILLLEAVLLVHTGQFETAAGLCQTLLSRDVANAGANHVLGLCFEEAGDLAEARRRYAMASRLDPEFAMPRLHLGLLARRTGDLGAARAELGQALTLLDRETAGRIVLFGSGFDRNALVALCRAELRVAGVPS